LLSSRTEIQHLPKSPNYFAALSPDADFDTDIMDIDSPSPSQSTLVVASWTTNAGVSELSDDIFSHLQQKKQRDSKAGELAVDAPTYIKPQRHIDSKTKISHVYDLTFSSTEESMLTSQHLNCSNHLHPLSAKQILPISFYHTIRTNNIIHLYQRLSTFRHLTKAKCLYTSNPTTNAKCIC